MHSAGGVRITSVSQSAICHGAKESRGSVVSGIADLIQYNNAYNDLESHSKRSFL